MSVKLSNSMQDVEWPYLWLHDVLVPRLTSAGTSAPHCATFHALCSSNAQNIIIKSNMTRVKNGNRKM